MAIWGSFRIFNESAKSLLREEDLFISPIERLELEYLHNLERADSSADSIIDDLSLQIGLTVCQKPFDKIISLALPMVWTRDPFDRILVAHASVDNNILLSRDRKIRQNYDQARW